MNEEQSKFKQYVTTKIAKQVIGVNEDTLRRWSDNGKIQTIRSPGGKRLYNINEFLQKNKNIETTVTTSEKEQINSTRNEQNQYICYCRVSSNNQKDDLQRQIKQMQEQYPNHQVITDIGSGINWKRKGLQTILDLANKKLIKEVVVAYRDRLCRFAFELIEWILQQNKVKLMVLHSSMESSEQSELAEDLLAIINIFNCRVNGRRKYKPEKTKTTKKESQSECIKKNN